LAEHEAKLAATAGEVRAMLDEARRDAEVTKKRIEEEGRKAASDEVARAVREIDRAKDSALQDLAVTSANLAIELGQKVVRDQLHISPEHQARIVRDALAKLGSAADASNN
jgi:F-type H+-transporting ATPase subunit b